MSKNNSPGAKLRALLATGEQLLLPGVADPLTARILQGMGFKGLQVGGWVTGASVATPEPLLTMTEQVEIARKVAEAVDIPVRGDAHTGFGEPIHIMRTVQMFEDAGLAGVHIEDQVFPKRASYHRGLEHVCDLDEFQRRLEFALKARRDDNFMIVARTDAGNAYNGSWKEAARRARAVKAMGIDILLPHTRTKDEIEKFRQEYPDNDLVLECSSFYNGLTPEQYRAYGYQLISYPLATVITQMAATIELYRGLQKTGVLTMDPAWAKEVRTAIETAQGMEDFWAIEDATVEAESKHEGRHIAGYEGIEQKKEG